ncbi:MAG: carbohydrate kinase [Cyclobacteriaceae bacterium]|nr:carbohydrate kinase [Cyclobacteriaceae bacterium]
MLLGYDLGSSSIKATLINSQTGEVMASATYPKQEMEMISKKQGWAEQKPETWWNNIKSATKELMSSTRTPKDRIRAIGISYQMHGLVLVDKEQQVLRPAIIWCDSRAVAIGKKAFHDLSGEYCLGHYLNSPGNFTASKLKWVKDNEPELYEKIYKAMLPGDYIAMKMTGQINTTVSGLSEGIFWDFKSKTVADKLLKYYGIEQDLLPEIVDTFSVHGQLTAAAANELGLEPGTRVAYRAGDQPNNAFSLNVLNAGEVAATAGTSGVVYGIIEKPEFDPLSRVNTFVHVNNTKNANRYGVLLCVNGTGILNSWMQKNIMDGLSYKEMNEIAMQAPIGADNLSFIPFGNGAERIMENNDIGASLLGLNFNRHNQSHILRAGQEGIVFALNYGFTIMKEMGMELKTIRAGHANMFLSPLFAEAFANITCATVELYNTDGAQGAARGAGIGAGVYGSFADAFTGLKSIKTIEPSPPLFGAYEDAYGRWLKNLNV